MTEQAVLSGHALIVEDDAAIGEVLDEILMDVGFETTCCSCGRDGLAQIERQHFDLLLLDLHLPDMDGIAVCRQAREQLGETAVIMVVTAEQGTASLITAIDVGADDVIRKPFNIDELITRIEVKFRRVPPQRPGYRPPV